MKVDLAKWWKYLFWSWLICVTLSLVFDVVAFVQVFIYFIGCGSVVVLFFKVVIGNVFHNQKQAKSKNSFSKKKKVTKPSLPIQQTDKTNEEVNMK